MRQFIKATFVGFIDTDGEPKFLTKELYEKYLQDNPGFVPLVSSEFIHEITLDNRKAVAIKIAQ